MLYELYHVIHPFPSQKVHLDAYPESVLRLVWADKPDFLAIDYNPDITMPDMRIDAIRTGYCNGTYATGQSNFVEIFVSKTNK